MLEIKHIKKDYEERPLLRDVSFSVEKEETICLLGPSGGGKSTLLRIIAGLENPDSGEIFWNGGDISPIPPHKRRFGLMFQDYALFPHLNVYENIAFGLRLQGNQEDEIRDRVRDALKTVNMQRMGERSVIDLSGGEKQRVAFARALAPKPDLLMLDEPMGSLDRTLRDRLLKDLHGLLDDMDVPVIYVTHDQEEAFTVADRILILHDGEIVQAGSPQEVYTHPIDFWVASFLGFSNHLKGRISSVDPVVVDTAIGKIMTECNWNSLSKGCLVDLVILPDALQVDNAASKLNQYTGQVLDCVFTGTAFTIKIRIQDQSEFSFQVDDSIPRGESLRFSIHPEGVLCFESDQ